MAKELPFDDDVMTLIMGLGGPDEPGQHGRTTIPAPQNSAIDLVTKIKEMCEDFLFSADKKEEKPEEKKAEVSNEDLPDTDEEE